MDLHCSITDIKLSFVNINNTILGEIVSVKISAEIFIRWKTDKHILKIILFRNVIAYSFENI